MYGYERETLYSQARNRGQWGRVWSALSGRSRRLLSLNEVDATCTVDGRRYTGIRTVPIDRIRGSEGRSNDFDRDFNPLQDHTRERWLSIAQARERGKALPPVALVLVGDVYFVRDGHHRISVARTLGQREIEAEVAVWKVSGSLPWELSATASHPTGQRSVLARSCTKVKESCVRLEKRFLMGLRGALAAVTARSRAPSTRQARASSL